MRADLVIKSRSLTGSSDLTLLAPLKHGLVPSLESLTYRTRTLRLLKVLNGGRTSSHEFAMQRPIADSVERVAHIHSFRVAVLEPENKVLLAVTFDGTWDAYIRVLWQKVGTLLDIIFCNTEGYVLSLEGFEAWTGWVRKVQIETSFFFTTHGLTVGDAHYLREFENIHRSEPDPARASLAAVRLSLQSAERKAFLAGRTTPIDGIETLRQGLQALALLFRMTDLYLPGTPDGDVLLRAARDLLSDFRSLIDDPDAPADIMSAARDRFGRQLDWLAAAGQPAIRMERQLPPPPTRPEIEALDDVQGGMLAGYDVATHGCLVLLAFDNAAKGAAFLKWLRPRVTTAAPSQKSAGPFYNVAFTLAGLRAFGLIDAEIEAWLPQDFREGMEERSSMLGDFRSNHPRRWRLPRTNWRSGADTNRQEVRLAAVHLVVQIRARCDPNNGIEVPSDPGYPMHDFINDLVLPGVNVLSVQPMQRLRNERQEVIEHFGFVDGQAQPEFMTAAGQDPDNKVQVGELLLGYPNEVDFAPDVSRDTHARLEFLRNGSFMVVRKLRQDVPALRAAIRDAEKSTGVDAATLLAKMMGRWQGGSPLVLSPDPPPASGAPLGNDFTFEDDPEGARCPFHAHVRRANPRSPSPLLGESPGRRRPRIVRRGMSYGKVSRVLPGAVGDTEQIEDDRVDRGLVFIAYNASISEQFEVVQRWIAGGNSTGGFSGHSDPLLGVPEAGQRRHFRFEATTGTDAETKSVVVALDTGPPAFEEAKPFVRLEWGAYLFVPSMHTLDWIRARARSGVAPVSWDVEAGKQTIRRLEAVLSLQGESVARDSWKAALEDSGADERLDRASTWAAVRALGGARRTPYGVLVASRKLVDEVLGDDRRFSVSGYRQRMLAGRFDIYLGLDHGSRYEQLSHGVNAAIMRIGKEEAFLLAATATEAVLRAFIDVERSTAALLRVPGWELNIDVKEVLDQVQQRLCQEWLGLPSRRGGAIEPGSWRWDWDETKPAVYPAHFTPPSRYFFQPNPGEDVRRYGERHAAALAAALETFIEPHRKNGSVPSAPSGLAACLAVAILNSTKEESDATVARIFAGVLMGFLPTLDASLRLVIHEWLRLDSFWSLRAAWALDPREFGIAKAQALLEPAMRSAMQFRPSPEVIWRTVQRDSDSIGGVPLAAGDIVVVSLISAMHEAQAAGNDDVMPVFGGIRRHDAPPTHACPGYAAAMGVMLGVLAAFVDVKEVMRSSPAPLAFTLEGSLV